MSDRRATRSLAKEVRTLGLGSFTFLIPTLLTRGLTFILTPVYTRYMSPADYGIVGLGSTLLAVFALFLGLSIQSSAGRLHHQLPNEESQRRLVGTILGFLLVVPPAIALVVEVLGSTHVITGFRSAPYSPYLRLVVWASVLVLFQNLALNVLMVRESHRQGASLNALAVLTTAGFTLLFVVVLRKGAYGQLLALLIANAVIATWAIRMLWRVCPPMFDRALLKDALLFSLPLVPHELSKWILAASDRVILERYVDAADLGRYALGYSFGSAIGIFLSAVGTALFPIVSRKLAEKDPHEEVPVLGSLVILASTFASLGAATVFPSFVRLVTPHAYDGAGAVIPWVAVGFFFQALYLVWSQGTFFARRTVAVAGVTFVGAGLNILLNILLVPHFGYLVAAVTTAVGYAVMAGCHGLLSRKLMPIRWEYGRYVCIALAALATYFVAVLPHVTSATAEIFVRAAITLAMFPVALLVLRAVRLSEIQRVRALLATRGR